MSRRAWVLFIAMSLLWGMPYLLIKIVVAEIDPPFMVFARLAMSAVVLLPLAAARGSLGRVMPRWRLLLLIAAIGIVVPFVAIGYGEQYVTSSLAALLIAADPLFIVLLALKFDPSERASGWRLVGLGLGFVGVATLLGVNVGGDGLTALLGSALVLLAALCYAVSALLFKQLAGVPPLGVTAMTLGLAAALLAPIALFSVPTRMPSATVLVALAGLGLVCTALAYVIYFNLIVEAGASRAALITYVNPAVAVVLGVAILGEPITVGTIVGFVMIIVGCALSTGVVRLRREPIAPAPQGAAPELQL